MTTQKRPLSGMVQVTGEAKPILLAGVPVTVHTEDATTVQQAGPFADEVSIFANNPTNAAIVLTLTVNGVPLVYSIAAEGTEALLIGAVFRSPDAAAAGLITAQGQGLIIFGWFARPL